MVSKVEARELRDFSYDELIERLKQAKEELFNLRFQAATGQLDNTSRIVETKRDIARIFTVIREQELREQELNEELNEEVS
ncbi:MAG: 50S ribosomal protein L29 [Candidatus Solincola sediminis]|uniref:Large ribosomal subunit protein uL29 n=1 Tax=Candidatus Solincola sediminis TaxID=1797199 RepID=A0A1F2WHZ1_9ACTN|nr:MAG: 50S ribosomal protein L29 [Candidatus Solincola sediminis]OFW59814.1 MAG: 50S ribosomal protein L29 [Candidatus Solincola sediminis]